MRVDQLERPAAVVDLATVHRAILVDVVVQRELLLDERLPFHQNVLGTEAHGVLPWQATISDFFPIRQTSPRSPRMNEH